MIVSLEGMAKIVAGMGREYFALTSGGYDPVHPGHVSSISDSAKLTAFMIVVVNGDDFLICKKGRPFMPLSVRASIIDSLKNVSFVVPFNPTDKSDMTVCEALRVINPAFFTKGGDRNIDNIPETKVCEELGISIVQGMGDDKLWSSSDFLKKWDERYSYPV